MEKTNNISLGPVMMVVGIVVCLVFAVTGFEYYVHAMQNTRQICGYNADLGCSTNNTVTGVTYDEKSVGNGDLENFDSFVSAEVDADASSVDGGVNTNMTAILTKTFGKYRIVEYTPSRTIVTSTVTMLLYVVPRNVTADDISSIKSQLNELGYRNLQINGSYLTGEFGEQYNGHIMIGSDVSNRGVSSGIIRVFVY